MSRAVWHAGAIAISLFIASATAASAQTPRPPREPRVEVSFGGLFMGGFDAGLKNADLVANQTGGSPYTLFKSESRIDSTAAFEARLGVRLSRLITVEGGVFTARPQLTTRLTADVEGIPDTTVSEDLSVYIIDGAVLLNFGARPGASVVPFARAGVGYLRELHEDNSLVKTGYAFHAGGGVSFWFNQRQTIGARADARLYVIHGGIDLDGGTRRQGAVGAAVVFAF